MSTQATNAPARQAGRAADNQVVRLLVAGFTLLCIVFAVVAFRQYS